jgi:cytochrome c
MMDRIHPVGLTPRINSGRSRYLSFFICYLLSAICYSRILAAGPDNTGTGQRIFQTRCFVCHGRDGRGSGPASQGLSQKPQDLTDPSWQRSVTDDQIKTVIRAGGAILGKSGAMPPNPDLSDDDLHALLAYVRHLAGTP